MALEKRVIEFPFDKGLDQKVATEVAPDGLIHTIENADLSRVGKYKRRSGYTVLSNSVVAPAGDFTFNNITKLASRDNQLIAVSSNRGRLGSGAGGGASGDTLFSYSEEYDAWKAHAKLPRPTCETMFSFSQDGNAVTCGDCAIVGDIIMFAFNRPNTDRIAGGKFAQVYDLASQTVIREPTLVSSSTTPPVAMKCLAVGTKLYAFWTQDNAGIDEVYGTWFDTANQAGGFLTAALITAAGADVESFDVCTDGTSVFLIHANTTNSVTLEKLDPTTLGNSGTTTFTIPAGTCTAVGCSTAGGIIHCVMNGSATMGVYFAQCTTALASPTVPSDVFAAGLTRVPTMVTVASSSATEAFIFAFASGPTTDDMPYLWWSMVSPTATATKVGNSSAVGNVRPFLKPFFLSSRLYIGLQGWDGINQDYGYTLCELDSSGNATNGQYSTPMPVASWGNDVSISWAGGGSGADALSIGCRSSNCLYAITGIKFRSYDVFMDNTTTSPIGAWRTFDESGFRLMKLDFEDSKRWQEARHGAAIVFGGGIPYCFDGTHAFDCGFIWRPAILSCTRNTDPTPVLPQNTTLVYKVTYEYWDTDQRRWQSVPNLATEAIVETSAGATETQSVDLVIRTPTISAMPRGGFYFFGGIRVCVWRSESASPDEFILIYSEKIETFSAFNISLSDTFTHGAIESNERMYTWGGELENYSPPPCRALRAHRDRLFAINTETNELWYTKPLMNGRGAEWSRYQKLPLFEKGVALGATEGALLVFTTSGVYALQGSGPSITGQPVDAFSKLYKISGEIGCVENCAAFDTPIGVIFRGRQGLWLVDKSMSLRYIGAPVEEFMSTVDEMVSGDADEKKGVIRFVCRQGSTYKVLNFWYDTNRWSYDTCAAHTINSATVHKGVYYQSRPTASGSTPGVWKNDPEVFDDDGTWYAMKVKTHWFRFGQMAQVKRVWRALANVTAVSDVGLSMRIDRDLSQANNQTETFDYTALSSNFGHPMPRIHMEVQKVTSLRVTLEETQTAGTDTEGAEFLGLSFELGMKRGAAKMNSVLSK
jgi:hypothetical protein